jgi:hypothetical protein
MAGQARKEVQEFLLTMNQKLREQVMQVLETSEKLAKFIADLNALGIVVEIDFDCNIQMHVKDTFQPPQDLSSLSESKLDEMIPDDEFNKWLKGKG